MPFSKEDIEYHADRNELRPAVNVKAYTSLADGYAQFRQNEPDVDARFTPEWIEEHCSDDVLNGAFLGACEIGWETLNEEAREIWGHAQQRRQPAYLDRNNARKYSVNVYSEGRSGGWAVVDGIDLDVAGWNAIALGKWARFSKVARAIADDVMQQAVWGIWANHFECWAQEESERLGAEAFAPEAMPR